MKAQVTIEREPVELDFELEGQDFIWEESSINLFYILSETWGVEKFDKWKANIEKDILKRINQNKEIG